MLEELRDEEVINKVGGRFKLSTLIQKRLVALNQGSAVAGRPAHRRQDEDRYPEIMQDKIYLDTENNLRVTGGEAGRADCRNSTWTAFRQGSESKVQGPNSASSVFPINGPVLLIWSLGIEPCRIGGCLAMNGRELIVGVTGGIAAYKTARWSAGWYRQGRGFPS